MKLTAVFMKVPGGDHKTLVELNKKDPDMEVAKQGFKEGRNHADDVPGMINLFRRFHSNTYINKAIVAWKNADSLVTFFGPIGEELHAEINSPNYSQENINKILLQIDPLNEKVTKFEDDFSFALGEGSRWLESVVFGNVEALDGRLRTECVYSQVPAFSAADRAMIDVLALTRENRLAVVELKADEDIHLPLQGVDYWSRVTWHQDRGEFRKFGYFPGHELSALKPLLLLIAPALHVHPATDTILRYLSPEIEWELLGIDERWRDKMRVVFRKRPSDLRSSVAVRQSA